MGQFHIPFSMSSWEVGTCSHTLTVMKLIAKWTIYKLTKISEIKAFTSKTSDCLFPQSRRKLFKSAILEMFLISPSIYRANMVYTKIRNTFSVNNQYYHYMQVLCYFCLIWTSYVLALATVFVLFLDASRI